MTTTHSIPGDLGYSRTIYYTCKNDWSLIFQRWGSVTSKAMPYCIVNMIICVILIILLAYDIDLTISVSGHEFMSILVSFLVINKLSFTISLYYELQGHLSNMNQATIELTQLACAFTKRNSEDSYKKWRYELTYYATILLSSTVSVIHKGGKNNVWEKIQLRDRDPLLMEFPPQFGRKFASKERVEYPKEMYVMGGTLKSDLNLRVPIRVAHHVVSTAILTIGCCSM
jgi:hypothetical protein